MTLRIRPQRESLSIRSVQVDYSSGASSPSSARSAPDFQPTGTNSDTFELRKYEDIIGGLLSSLDHLTNVRKSSRQSANCLYSFFEITEADMHHYFRDRGPDQTLAGNGRICRQHLHPTTRGQCTNNFHPGSRGQRPRTHSVFTCS